MLHATGQSQDIDYRSNGRIISGSGSGSIVSGSNGSSSGQSRFGSFQCEYA